MGDSSEAKDSSTNYLGDLAERIDNLASAASQIVLDRLPLPNESKENLVKFRDEFTKPARELAIKAFKMNEELVSKVIPLFPKEAQEHLAKSYTEFLMAIESLAGKKEEKEKKELKKFKVE